MNLASTASHGRVLRQSAVCLALLLFTLGVYYPALEANLVADDFRLVGHINFENAGQYLFHTWGFGRNEFRPVTAVSFAWDNFLWGDVAPGYHLTNILLHALAGILLFVWCEELLGSFRIALLAAAIFLVHPVNHSRVAWISAREGPLSTCFVLASLWWYTRYRKQAQEPAAPVPDHVYLYLSVAAFAASLLCYEGAVVVPLLAGAAEIVLLSQQKTVGARFRSAILLLRPYGVVLTLYLAFWAWLFGGSVGGYQLSSQPLSVLKNYQSLFYRLFYGHNRVAGLLYVATTTLAWFALRAKRKALLFCFAAILIAYLPFAATGGFASRFAYASCLAYSIALAVLLVAADTNQEASANRRRVAVALIAAFLVYYIADSRKLLRDWREAGHIARSIPAELKRLHTQIPAGATVVLGRIPRMKGRAYVFPLGLRAAIRREMGEMRFPVEYGDAPVKELVCSIMIPQTGQKYAFFEYSDETRTLTEVISNEFTKVSMPCKSRGSL
jgi:hypothetical protein